MENADLVCTHPFASLNRYTTPWVDCTTKAAKSRHARFTLKTSARNMSISHRNLQVSSSWLRRTMSSRYLCCVMHLYAST